uniref:Uncharacterized protein n=1 Tax=Arundo donax TaxID=35708 RepID=A0A0A8Z5N6_ARUDO
MEENKLKTNSLVSEIEPGRIEKSYSALSWTCPVVEMDADQKDVTENPTLSAMLSTSVMVKVCNGQKLMFSLTDGYKISPSVN